MEGNEEQTTLDLDQVMKDGLQKFDGELAEAAGEEEAESTDKASPADEAESKEEKEETETTKEKPEETEEDAAGEKEKKTPQDRFETKEAAEDSYRNLQAKTTRVEQENAELRKKVVELEQADQVKAEMEKAEAEYEEYAANEYEKALTQIDELDADAEDYQKQVARIFARRDLAIKNYEREHGIQTESEASSAESEGPSAETTKGPEISDDDDDQTTVKKLLEFRDAEATRAGIDPTDKHFLLECRNTPSIDEKGKQIPFKDQVQWAIDETKKYHAAQEQAIHNAQRQKNERKAQEEQAQHLPMGRSSTPIKNESGKEKETKPVSLDDALESAKELRTL